MISCSQVTLSIILNSYFASASSHYNDFQVTLAMQQLPLITKVSFDSPFWVVWGKINFKRTLKTVLFFQTWRGPRPNTRICENPGAERVCVCSCGGVTWVGVSVRFDTSVCVMLRNSSNSTVLVYFEEGWFPVSSTRRDSFLTVTSNQWEDELMKWMKLSPSIEDELFVSLDITSCATKWTKEEVVWMTF